MKTKCGIDIVKLRIDIDKRRFITLNHFDGSNGYGIETENYDFTLSCEHIEALIKMYHYFKNLEKQA